MSWNAKRQGQHRSVRVRGWSLSLKRVGALACREMAGVGGSGEERSAVRDALEPAAVTAGGFGGEAFRAACGAAEQAAEILNQVEPAFSGNLQPREQRLHFGGDRAAFVATQLLAGPAAARLQSGVRREANRKRSRLTSANSQSGVVNRPQTCFGT